MKTYKSIALLLFATIWFGGCNPFVEKSQNLAKSLSGVVPSKNLEQDSEQPKSEVVLAILGVAQDGGYPHIGCIRECCKALLKDSEQGAQVVSLAVVSHSTNQVWMLEATPDFTNQNAAACAIASETPNPSSQAKPKRVVDGIFITHAHIGHYTGLMYLGREAMGAKGVPVYAMPKLSNYLQTNGPWSQLVELGNIELSPLANNQTLQLTDQLSITPALVPHRDEFSETVGYTIQGPNKSALFIPDIDKWSKWDKDLITEIAKVDYALLDATFFADGEIGRAMSEVPHPFVSETMALLKDLPAAEKAKVHFIHFNHTNPLMDAESDAYRSVADAGFVVSEERMQLGL